MKEFGVRILRRAQGDLLKIKSDIARDAPNASVAMVDRLLKRIESLHYFPYRGARPRDELLRSKGYRFLVERPYLVFYKIVSTEVRIYRVIHGKRSYKKLL